MSSHSSFEFNKIFAAVLVAGIAAMMSGFIAQQLVHPHKLEKNAVEIEGAAAVGGAGGGPALPEPILDMIATADVAKGQALSKACAACHSFNQGEPNKIGPNLWGVVHADKGHHAGFEYSDAMKQHGGKWSYEELNHFLWKPKDLVPGTKMSYIGLKKPEDRAAMIAWLRTLTGSPAALPSEAEIAQEKKDFGGEAEETAPDGSGVAGEVPVNAPSSGIAPEGGQPVKPPADENIKPPSAPSDVDTKQPPEVEQPKAAE